MVLLSVFKGPSRRRVGAPSSALYSNFTGVTAPNRPNADKTTSIKMIINITLMIAPAGAGRGSKVQSQYMRAMTTISTIKETSILFDG
jgi:hypothetical protein